MDTLRTFYTTSVEKTRQKVEEVRARTRLPMVYSRWCTSARSSRKPQHQPFLLLLPSQEVHDVWHVVLWCPIKQGDEQGG